MSDAAEHNAVIAEIMNDPKLFEVLRHPLFLQTLAHYSKDTFNAQGSKGGFWANGLVPEIKDGKPVVTIEPVLDSENKQVIGADGNPVVKEKPVYRHHGHENLRNFGDVAHSALYIHPEKDNSDPKDHRGIIALNNTFETQTGFREGEKILNLSEIEGDDALNSKQKQSLCALQSLLYASAAKDTVVTSVQGASPNSFFRTTEIYSIMNNNDVTKIQILSEDMAQAKLSPDGVGTRTLSAEIPKKEAYHQLRDEWVQSATTKYKEAQDRLTAASGADIPVAVTAFMSARESLIKEQEIARHMGGQTHPFTKGGFYDKTTSPQYNVEDKEREKARVTAIEGVLKKTPSTCMDKVPEEIKKSSKENVSQFVKEQTSTKMTDMDKILYVGMKVVESMNDISISKDHAKDGARIGDVIDALRASKDKSLDSIKTVAESVAKDVYQNKIPSRSQSLDDRSDNEQSAKTNSFEKSQSAPANLLSAASIIENFSNQARRAVSSVVPNAKKAEDVVRGVG